MARRESRGRGGSSRERSGAGVEIPEGEVLSGGEEVPEGEEIPPGEEVAPVVVPLPARRPARAGRS